MQRARTTKTLSCAECRRLKIKCDLKFPCAHCVKRRLADICPTGELREGLRGQRVLAGTEDLHKRIAELEAALRDAMLQQPSSSIGVQEAGSTSVPSDREVVSDATDRLSSYSHLVEDEPGKSRYYGAASSAYLTRRPRPGTSSTAPPLFDLPSPFGSADTSDRVLELARACLPEEDQARRLVTTYYDSFGWYTNILPRATFYRKFFDPFYMMHAASSAGLSQPLCVLFLVLALGSVMIDDRNVGAYIAAAREALSLDPAHSVTMVQICYLYVTYVINRKTDTAGGEAGWPYLRAGMAVAEAIGLHRDPAQWDLEDATERRIVFWEIHGYDVLQSIALGRGQCIADHAIDCDFPDDGDETGFHVKTYALTRIWSRINTRQIRISPSTYSDVIGIDDALDDYQRSLPAHLGFSASTSLLDMTDPDRKRLVTRRNMLLMYLTEARMSLHRGWFVRTLKEYPNEPLDSPQSRSYVACLEACRTLTELVRNMLSLHDQQINKRWHFFFHLFSACACMAACVIRAPRGRMAGAVMAELENGIGLFRLARREETAQLQRLAEAAKEAIRVGQSGAEMEDLDLLSARKTYRRSEAGGNSFPIASGERPASADPLTMGTPGGSTEHPSETAGSSLGVADDLFAGNPGISSGFSPFGQFDMDAFLQEMGLL